MVDLKNKLTYLHWAIILGAILFMLHTNGYDAYKDKILVLWLFITFAVLDYLTEKWLKL